MQYLVGATVLVANGNFFFHDSGCVMRHSCLLSILILLCAGCERSAISNSIGVIADSGDDIPFLAIWCADNGSGKRNEPSLRIAVWDDGRIVFAEDPTVWSYNLRYGRLASEEVDSLKESLVATSVFDLEDYCFLLPLGQLDCVLTKVGVKEKILYLDGM